MSISTFTRSIKFDVPNSPISGMTFYLNRIRASENEASLNLRKRYLFDHNPKKNEYEINYLSEMFKNREVRIIFAQSECEDTIYIDCVFIDNLIKVRQVVDILKANKILTQSEGEELDSFVKEMEVNLNYSSKVADSITDYQVALIRKEIGAFIGVIVQRAENLEQALVWIKEVVNNIKIFGELDPLFTYSTIGNDMDLREALVNVAKVYLSRANLEGALAKLGVNLPSGKIIKKNIVDMLKEGFAGLPIRETALS